MHETTLLLFAAVSFVGSAMLIALAGSLAVYRRHAA
jgi:hypothetical protein